MTTAQNLTSKLPDAALPISGPSTPLTVGLFDSEITLSRANSREIGTDVMMDPEGQDAIAFVYRLAEFPEHDCWVGGRYGRFSGHEKSSFQLIDLNLDVRGFVRGSFDQLVIGIPRAALLALANANNVRRNDWYMAPHKDYGIDPVLQRLEQSLVYLLQNPSEHHQIVQENLMLTLLSHLATRHGDMSSQPAAKTGGLAPWQTRRAQEALGDDLGTNISLTELAKRCELSPSHFSRAFKVSTGLSPYAWLQRHRLERAKDMLTRGDAPLAEIAVLCGFTDQSHLGRLFVREVGTSPLAWQRSRSPGKS